MFIAAEGVLDPLSQLLEIYINDPVVFLGVLFVFSILTAIILPIPVEIALLGIIINPTFFSASAITLGVGKAVGAGAIFVIGLKVEAPIRYWCARHRWVGRFVGYATRFVRATRWIGLFVLLSIPFMFDTIPIYIYSIFNKQGQLIGGRVFLLVNFVAGVIRALLAVVLFQLGFDFLVF